MKGGKNIVKAVADAFGRLDTLVNNAIDEFLNRVSGVRVAPGVLVNFRRKLCYN
ncbi:hypothetical protein ES703_111077 [subsurface metagenome]